MRCERRERRGRGRGGWAALQLILPALYRDLDTTGVRIQSRKSKKKMGWYTNLSMV